jgi:hypothetical protein
MRLNNSKVSSWNDAGRPDSSRGKVGCNTESSWLEIYTGSGWKKLPLTSI